MLNGIELSHKDVCITSVGVVLQALLQARTAAVVVVLCKVQRSHEIVCTCYAALVIIQFNCLVVILDSLVCIIALLVVKSTQGLCCSCRRSDCVSIL